MSATKSLDSRLEVLLSEVLSDNPANTNRFAREFYRLRSYAPPAEASLEEGETLVPPRFSAHIYTLGSSALILDLTQIKTIDSAAADCTGLTPFAWQALAAEDNAGVITVAADNSNGFPVPTITLGPGDLWHAYLPTQLAVDATHKQIRVTGTTGDKLTLTLAAFDFSTTD